MSASIPAAAAAATVAVVGANGPLIRHFGSGTLLAVADRRFVVTAAHVIRKAHEFEATVGISGGLDNYFVATSGNWILSHNDALDDPFDIALYPLTQSQTERFHHRAFIRIADASFAVDLSRGFFVVSGFPSIWTTDSRHAEETLKLRMLQYSTYACNRDAAALQGYDARHHLLLEASPEQLFDVTGSSMQFRTLNGYAAQMPQDLRGISGCSVWMIGSLDIPCENWRPEQAKLVAVETGVFSGHSTIKVTRWNAVTTLLYAAFPDLRATIQFYADQLG